MNKKIYNILYKIDKAITNRNRFFISELLIGGLLSIASLALFVIVGLVSYYLCKKAEETAHPGKEAEDEHKKKLNEINKNNGKELDNLWDEKNKEGKENKEEDKVKEKPDENKQNPNEEQQKPEDNKEENKDNKTAPPQQEQPAHSANEGGANPFSALQDMMKNMPKHPSANEQKNESPSNNQSNKIMPTINAGQQNNNNTAQKAPLEQKQPEQQKQQSFTDKFTKQQNKKEMINLDTSNKAKDKKKNNSPSMFN